MYACSWCVFLSMYLSVSLYFFLSLSVSLSVSIYLSTTYLSISHSICICEYIHAWLYVGLYDYIWVLFACNSIHTSLFRVTPVCSPELPRRSWIFGRLFRCWRTSSWTLGKSPISDVIGWNWPIRELSSRESDRRTRHPGSQPNIAFEMSSEGRAFYLWINFFKWRLGH